MNKSKRKGSLFENQVADYLTKALDTDIERRVLQGANDRGDISGLKLNNKRVVVECKACKKFELSKWIKEAETERINDKAAFGIVVVKRPGIGEARTGEQLVCMTLETFTNIIKSRSN